MLYMPVDTPVTWPDVKRAELDVIRKQGGDANERLGLAFSGGGIRSATFNLGVLQALARHGLLMRVDYLSTVSGGGYIGGWFQAWLIREYYELRIGELEQRLDAKPDLSAEPPHGIDAVQDAQKRRLRRLRGGLGPAGGKGEGVCMAYPRSPRGSRRGRGHREARRETPSRAWAGRRP